MNKYKVVIKATIVKDIVVEAAHEDDAVQFAHNKFTTNCNSDPEQYEEQTMSVVEL